jgi:hypothetical protein
VRHGASPDTAFIRVGEEQERGHSRPPKIMRTFLLNSMFSKLARPAPASGLSPHLFDDCACGRRGVFRVEYRAADDDEVRARAHGLGRRHDALLVFVSRGRRVNAGRDDEEGRARDRSRTAISCGEATTPSRPEASASRARRRTCASTDSALTPVSSSVRASALVSTVTAMRLGFETPRRAASSDVASDARRNISPPPEAWTLKSATPRRTASRHAPATVFGMSWNFRSRKTRAPSRRAAHEVRPGRSEEP